VGDLEGVFNIRGGEKQQLQDTPPQGENSQGKPGSAEHPPIPSVM